MDPAVPILLYLLSSPDETVTDGQNCWLFLSLRYILEIDIFYCHYVHPFAVTGPGFPIWEGRQLLILEQKPITGQKLHENERNWTREKGVSP